ncbi:MAG: FecR domain-containing protein [Planctomycetes bacterium]|nr:FecR domain-containing protein [Planctomycetota bacterium]
MNDGRDEEYLWDKSGVPDAELARIERLLGRYRFASASARAPWSARSARPRWILGFALVAAAVLAVAVLWRAERAGLRASYAVAGLESVERARAGDALATRAGETAVLTIASLGSVTLEPHSRLRVEDTGARVHKLFLERGALRASIFARPEEFQVDTPSGLSIDLGCEYTLAVEDDGSSRVRVETGRVAFAAAGRRVIVPAGAEMRATRRDGPSVPVRVAADAQLVAAIRRLEFAEPPEPADVRRVLDSDWREESVSIWHLFVQARSATTRREMYAVLAKLYPRPEGAREAFSDVERALAADQAALDLWRSSVERDWH